MHDYLGMTFDCSFSEEVRINIWDIIQKVIKEFSEETTRVCSTPDSIYLFTVREDDRKLNEEQEEVFHRTVFQLLFAANRARQNIQMGVYSMHSCAHVRVGKCKNRRL